MTTSEKESLLTLEIQCRLNYCSSKAKISDWAAILHQTKAVLKLQPGNAKANYKMGQALDRLGKKEKALGYVESSIKELAGDQIA